MESVQKERRSKLRICTEVWTDAQRNEYRKKLVEPGPIMLWGEFVRREAWGLDTQNTNGKFR